MIDKVTVGIGADKRQKRIRAQRPEVLTFRRGDSVATVVTDGVTHKTYEQTGETWHARLSSAIAYLECRGYNIDIDNQTII